MKIRYSKSAKARTFGNVPCHFKTDQAVTWLPREACAIAGFTDSELDQAEASPGDWIECPRPRTKDEAIAEITAGRDALLEACKFVLPDLQHYFKLCPCDEVSLRLGALVTAIARVEKT